MRDALRHMEEHKSKMEALRLHLMQGEEQAKRGEFATGHSIDNLLDELDRE